MEGTIVGLYVLSGNRLSVDYLPDGGRSYITDTVHARHAAYLRIGHRVHATGNGRILVHADGRLIGHEDQPGD